jgi:hypothetical protein
MIVCAGTSVTIFVNYNQYGAISDLYNLQFIVAHVPGLAIFTSHLLAADLNTETNTSNHYEVFLLFLLQSLCSPLS